VKYKVEIGPRAERHIRKIQSKKIKRAILERIAALGDDPRPSGSEKIKESYYRIRFRDYRIIYAILDDEQLVLIDSAKFREKDTYREYR
jgi:mRNA-degrading endonuclease RelE of RelBE toxin-antitoxin system